MQMEGQQKWTVSQLIERLQQINPDMRVELLDADTGWTITQFAVADSSDGAVTFFPSDYTEMEHG